MLCPCSHPDSYRRPQNFTESALAPKYEGSRAIPPVGTFTQTLQGVFCVREGRISLEPKATPAGVRPTTRGCDALATTVFYGWTWVK